MAAHAATPDAHPLPNGLCWSAHQDTRSLTRDRNGIVHIESTPIVDDRNAL